MGWERDYEEWRDSFHVGGEDPEIEERRRAGHKAARDRYEEAVNNGYLITYYGNGCCDACEGCEHLHHIGMRDDTDDIELMYCSDNQCPHVVRARLMNLIEDKVHEVFLEYQTANGIKTGDIAPMDASWLDELKEALANLVIRVGDFNKSEEATEESGQTSRLERIALHRQKEEEAREAKEQAKQAENEVLRLKIRMLQPRIANLLEVANCCYQNNVDIEPFLTEGIKHYLGFIGTGHGVTMIRVIVTECLVIRWAVFLVVMIFIQMVWRSMISVRTGKRL